MDGRQTGGYSPETGRPVNLESDLLKLALMWALPRHTFSTAKYRLWVKCSNF